MNENNEFNYTYSAEQREEIKRIREKYEPKKKEDDTMEKLRRLDAGATRGATVISLIIGIAGTLLLGVGMCCTMVWTDLFILGIVIGVIGIAGVIAAYPIYSKIAKKQREKIAPEIIRLTEEFMG